jgi:hypothetical protein
MTDFAVPAPTRVLAGTLARRPRQTYSFGDLVHARSQSDRAGDDSPAHKRYEEIRDRFEAEHGKIVDDYWCTQHAAGVALCCKPSRWGRLQWSLHRGMGNLAAAHPEYSTLLLHAAREAVRASNVLSGMTQRIAVSNLFALSRDLIVSLASKNVQPQDPAAYRRDLDDIADYAKQAGGRQAQVIYLKGMMSGLSAALLVIAPLLALALPDLAVPGLDVKLFVGCLVAGSFGATMSVIIRMSGGKFEVNHEIGREYVRNLGFARPYIGAIFAVLLYFAFHGGLLHQINVPKSPGGEFAFFVAAGFLIGFSERFAKDIIRTAESAAGGPQPAKTEAVEGAG